MADPTADEQARAQKAAENPLVQYFGGQKKPPTAPAAPTAPGYGSASNPAAQGANAAPKPNPQQVPTANNVGSGSSNVGNVAPIQNQAQGAVRPASPPAPQGPSPTNFTNFERYFGANQAASERTAASIQGREAMQAAQAKKALEDAQAKFNQQVTAGTVNGPEMGTASNADDGSGGLTGDSTRPELGGGLTSAQMGANADQTYTGPGGLGDTLGLPGASALYNQTNAAQQGIDATKTEGGLQALIQQQNPASGAGTSALSGGLVNAAGRKGFDALAAHFNPQADLNKAVTDSGTAADAAKALSAKNADAWATQAGIKGTAEANEQAYQQAKATAAGADADAKTAANAAQVQPKSYQQMYPEDTPQNRQDYMMGGVDRSNPKAVQQRQEEIAAYMKAQEMTTQNQMDQSFADVNAVFSPSTILANATGNKDQTQKAAQNQYNKSGIASTSGSTDQNHIPWDKAGADGFFVWRSMTPADWNDLNQHPSRSIFGNDQQAWIMTRAAQLRAKAGQATSTPGVGHSQQ